VDNAGPNAPVIHFPISADVMACIMNGISNDSCPQYDFNED
jgi:hypothetical protein